MNNNKSSNFLHIKNIFESISSEYDFMNDLMTFKNHSKWKKEIAEIAKYSSPKKILDIATGTGDIAINLSKINGSKIEGVDVSGNMLKIARKKIDELKIDNIALKTCEAENLVFEDNHFDIVSIGYGVRNFSNLEKGLSESYRVLKRDGKLIILETSVPENPIIKFFYKIITSIYIPIIAFIFSGKTKAYLYLLDSTKKFPPKNKFIEMLYKTGFEKVETRKKLYGASTIYIISK
jgi:demethylmenaquinone methyltransferase/2-methoxy-6-polyprenyl-1,4-benzoquinol methylase